MQLLRAIALCLSLLAGAACADRFSLSNPGNHPPPPPPPPALSGEHPTIGLVSAVGGASSVRLEWKRQTDSQDAPEVAVFVSSDRATLFAGAPIAAEVLLGHVVVEGLTGTQRYFAGLGLQAAPGDPYLPTGCVLEFHTGAPIYVNPAADPGGGDGMTPETAFGDIALGALIASAFGGGNVWVAEGSFSDVNLPLYTGVYLYGGFQPDFVLERRSIEHHRTVINGPVNQNVVDVHHGNFGPAVLDGVTLVGDGATTDGVGNLGHWMELHSVVIEDCKRGVKLVTASPTAVLVAGCSVSNSVLEGILADGPLDFAADSCVFEGNGNEGLALQNLRAPEFGSASLSVRASVFHANGQEGLDCHLDLVQGSGSGGGAFLVEVSDCDFVANAFSGMRIDVAYDASPAWTSEVVVRGVRSQSNGQAGVHLDLDSTGDALVQRLSASANGGDGLLVTSSALARMLTVSDSVLYGNQGFGIRCEAGACGLLASHCLLGGNASGGFSSALAPASLVSSILYLQPQPVQGVSEVGNVLQASASPALCLNLPDAWARIVAQDANLLTLDTLVDTNLGFGEVLDDGVSRATVFLAADQLTLEPAASLVTPALLGLFAGASVSEDFRLAPGSAAAGAGLAPPAGAPVDAGPFGDPHGGVPGLENLIPSTLFRLASSEPSWVEPLAPAAPLRLRFKGGLPDASTLAAGLRVLDPAGQVLAVSSSVVDDSITLEPPAGGWQTGQRIELFPGLRSLAGEPLLGTLLIPIVTP